MYNRAYRLTMVDYNNYNSNNSTAFIHVGLNSYVCSTYIIW